MVIADNRNGISGVQKENLGNDTETLSTNIYAQKCTKEINGRCLGCLQRNRLVQKYSGLFHVRNKQLHLKCFAQSIQLYYNICDQFKSFSLQPPEMCMWQKCYHLTCPSGVRTTRWRGHSLRPRNHQVQFSTISVFLFNMTIYSLHTGESARQNG